MDMKFAWQCGHARKVHTRTYPLAMLPALQQKYVSYPGAELLLELLDSKHVGVKRSRWVGNLTPYVVSLMSLTYWITVI